VREELCAALARVPRGGPTKELLSKRAVAKLLGVDRATTLETLIRAGRIRTVEVGGRPRIPRAELERVLVAGVEQS
jgi:excisionase family DNA binding protein